MAIERSNPERIHRPTGYVHVVRTSGTTVYIAGQVAADAEGNVVGEGDLGAQARQVFANLRTALASAGASFEHVAKMNVYIVGYRPEMREAYRAARAEAMGDGVAASTLVGVQALARPEYLIEIEAIAVLDD
jgi:enamine deaminase RidA (YjgF/YER057c/UK114 family)